MNNNPFVRGVTNALQARAGVAKDNTRNEFRGMSLREIARQCAIRGGVNVSGMSPLEFVGAAFSHSTSDFPNILENVLGKVLLDAYTSWDPTWNLWAAQGEVSDFKPNSRLKLGSFNNLAPVGESGEFKEFSIGEEKETIQAVTKGNIFAITRQAIINDDLGGFTRIASAMGQAAGRTVNADAYGVVTANAAIADGTALFHADHNNLAGSASALTVTSLSEGKAAMRKQKFTAASDEVLDIRAAYLVVPVALEDKAKTLIASETDPDQANSGKPNIHRNTLSVISDPTLDADSLTAWYLMSASDPIVEVDFLDGVDIPFLESQQGFTVDGIKWKVRLDYGQTAIDFRGAWKNAGV